MSAGAERVATGAPRLNVLNCQRARPGTMAGECEALKRALVVLGLSVGASIRRDLAAWRRIAWRR